MLIAVFLAALFLLPRPAWAVLVGLIVAVGGSEWARLCGLATVAAWLYGIVAAIGFGALFLIDGAAARGVLAAATLFWVLAVPLWLARGVRPRQRIALIVAGLVVLVPAGYAMAVLEPRHVLAALVLVWVADTAAYFVGRQWGRRKLAPSISPGKSWEGAWGGVVAALAYAIICEAFFFGADRWFSALVVAALLAVISIVGDLFESAAKRQAGAKDSGTLLPGHGGVMDRIDSATAVLPVAAFLLSFPNP